MFMKMKTFSRKLTKDIFNENKDCHKWFYTG